MRRFSFCLLLSACMALAACEQAPSPQYAAAVSDIRNRIDDYRGNDFSVKDFPARINHLINEYPAQPEAYAEAAHFLIFVGSEKGWPGRKDKPSEVAESFLLQAAQKNPKYCDIYWLRAQLHLVQKQNDRIAADVADAAHFKCDDPWLHVALGNKLVAEEKFDDAEAEFRRVLDAGPGPTSHSRLSYAGAAYSCGVLLYRTGQHDKLRDVLKRWEAAGLVFDIWGQVNLSYLLNLIGEFDRAQVAAQSALAVAEFVNARNALGLSLYGQAWSLEAAGRRPADFAKLADQARKFLADEKVALKTFWGAACCVSDAWKTVLRKHASAYPDLHLQNEGEGEAD